ncbi:MAG: N-acetyl-gamma-glutamyl-phosphate reductase [Candidatus Omnitrophica bacterium]|nr:N-acetyl-gamma-glutamyl-phosphate reductase [Candidatus Omnitrophota bacterium]
MVKVGVVGISGYSGLTALEILLNHPQVRVTYVGADSTTGTLSDIWPRLNGRTNLVCAKYDAAAAIESCDVIFLAVPHGISKKITPQLIKSGRKVIDLSGDYRLRDSRVYQKWYGEPHTDAVNLKKAVYGLPEIYRVDIAKAQLIANPGCYPTAAVLGLSPMLCAYGSAVESITIDAKSGVSGAGRKAKLELSYCEVNENFKAYKVLEHQHSPEIELYLSKVAQSRVRVDFVPHLLPINRGILETIYVRLKDKISVKALHTVYKRFYKIEPFVRIMALDAQPELKNVVMTNYCDIGLALSADRKLAVITSVIDNLGKGAAGQAVQNLNILCGFREQEGLL